MIGCVFFTREQIDTWNILAKARNEGRLFSRIEWPKDPEIVSIISYLHLLEYYGTFFILFVKIT